MEGSNNGLIWGTTSALMGLGQHADSSGFSPRWKPQDFFFSTPFQTGPLAH